MTMERNSGNAGLSATSGGSAGSAQGGSTITPASASVGSGAQLDSGTGGVTGGPREGANVDLTGDAFAKAEHGGFADPIAASRAAGYDPTEAGPSPATRKQFDDETAGRRTSRLNTPEYLQSNAGAREQNRLMAERRTANAKGTSGTSGTSTSK